MTEISSQQIKLEALEALAETRRVQELTKDFNAPLDEENLSLLKEIQPQAMNTIDYTDFDGVIVQGCETHTHHPISIPSIDVLYNTIQQSISGLNFVTTDINILTAINRYNYEIQAFIYPVKCDDVIASAIIIVERLKRLVQTGKVVLGGGILHIFLDLNISQMEYYAHVQICLKNYPSLVHLLYRVPSQWAFIGGKTTPLGLIYLKYNLIVLDIKNFSHLIADKNRFYTQTNIYLPYLTLPKSTHGWNYEWMTLYKKNGKWEYPKLNCQRCVCIHRTYPESVNIKNLFNPLYSTLLYSKIYE